MAIKKGRIADVALLCSKVHKCYRVYFFLLATVVPAFMYLGFIALYLSATLNSSGKRNINIKHRSIRTKDN